MLDFGPTPVSGDSLTNSPYHVENGSFSGTVWNQVQKDDFGRTFRGTHHADGTHRLVRAHQHERLLAEGQRGVGRGLRAEDVVLDGLAGVGLHHGHVLVGGAVEDDVRAVGVEDLADPPLVADVEGRGRDASPSTLNRGDRWTRTPEF